MIFCESKFILANSRFKVNHAIRSLSQNKKPPHFIGSADPVSNLHHVEYTVKENETELEKRLRIGREELQKWNEMFWSKHNTKFFAEKQKFESDKKTKNTNDSNKVLSADEMSEFYKQFLDSHWNVHLNYLLEWYKKLFYVTFLHFRVSVRNLFKNKVFSKA